MPDADIFCKVCNGTMIPLENNFYNASYRMKINTWRCSNCSRVVEEPRLDKERVYK